MKLITEHIEDIEYLVEKSESGEKTHFIKGIFMQAEQKNRNGRVYPIATLRKEVKRYGDVYVKNNRAFGELGHPDGPTINLERVSHMITSLEEDGYNNFIGKAKIMNTPNGNIVKNLIKEGAKLGVSSRGMGSLKSLGGSNIVQDDFYLATAADIVADPSAPNAFVEGIMEGREWIWEHGSLREQEISSYKRNIERTNRRQLEEKKLEIFRDFLSKL
jgi:hypothetical protein